MPRLPGCLFKFIQKQSRSVRKLKSRCSQKFLTKFTTKTPVLGSLFQISLKKRLWYSCFPVNFAKFLRTPFSQNTLLSCRFGDCCFFLLIFLSPSFHLFVASYRYLILSESILQLSYSSIYLSSLLFLIPFWVFFGFNIYYLFREMYKVICMCFL